MYYNLLPHITEKPPLRFEQIFTPFQVNKNKILLSTNLFVDLLCILNLQYIYYSTYRRMLFLANP